MTDTVAEIEGDGRIFSTPPTPLCPARESIY